jgi:hypothetical protein
MQRRKFLGTGLSFLALANPAFAKQAEYHMARIANYGNGGDVDDEDFWGWIREAYTMSPNIINFNNGGVAPQPKVL